MFGMFGIGFFELLIVASILGAIIVGVVVALIAVSRPKS